MKNQRGQGATEYIIILAVIAVVLVAFAPKIKEVLTGKATSTVADIQNASK